jgi:hypothetical protein
MISNLFFPAKALGIVNVKQKVKKHLALPVMMEDLNLPEF